MRFRRADVTLIISILLVTAGCGTGGDDRSDSEPTESTREVPTSVAAPTSVNSDQELALWLESWRDQWERTDEVFPAFSASSPGLNPGPLDDLVDIANGFIAGISAAGPPPADSTDEVQELRAKAEAMHAGFTIARSCDGIPQSGDDLVGRFSYCLEGSNDAMDAFQRFGLTLAGLAGAAGIDGPKVR